MSEFRHVHRTELTPVSFLERSAYVFPDKTAVVHGARRYTYRQLQERVNRLANGLRAAGLARQDRVAFVCPNTPAMLEAHYGVPTAGGVLVAINIRLSADEVGYILQHSGARFLFVDAEFEPVVKPLDLSGVRVVRVDDTGAAGDPYEDFLAQASPRGTSGRCRCSTATAGASRGASPRSRARTSASGGSSRRGSGS